MTLRLFLFLTTLALACGSRSLASEANYDSKKTYAEYLMSYGYMFETHKVATADGYLLTLWHIPGKIGQKRSRKPPVLLQHGLMDNGFSWLFKHIDRNFPVILADLGYDVWVGNSRGTIQSTEHRDLKNFDSGESAGRYWDYSFDEMGLYDFPAVVDYILDASGYEKLAYVGHSQGASQFFVKASTDPDYVNAKIGAFVGLSPVLYVKNAPGFFEKLAAWLPAIDLLYKLNLKNFWVTPGLLKYQAMICKYIPWVLPPIVQFIAGWTTNQTIDLDRIQMIAGNEPGGTSAQNLLHWMQLVRNGGFRKFDFGSEGNMQKYGTTTPPDYPVKRLGELKMPIYLMAGKADSIIGWEDLSALMQLLPHGFGFEQIDDYGHLDYIWADSAHTKIYPQIIRFLNGKITQ